MSKNENDPFILSKPSADDRREAFRDELLCELDDHSLLFKSAWRGRWYSFLQ